MSNPHIVVPQIVADQSFLNQTAAIPQTSILPASATGEYRISFYGATANTSVSSAVNVTLFWTDEFGVHNNKQSLVAPVNIGNPITYLAGVNFFVHALIGTDLAFSTELTLGSITYDLYLKVEQF